MTRIRAFASEVEGYTTSRSPTPEPRAETIARLAREARERKFKARQESFRETRKRASRQEQEALRSARQERPVRNFTPTERQAERDRLNRPHVRASTAGPSGTGPSPTAATQPRADSQLESPLKRGFNFIVNNFVAGLFTSDSGVPIPSGSFSNAPGAYPGSFGAPNHKVSAPAPAPAPASPSKSSLSSTSASTSASTSSSGSSFIASSTTTTTSTDCTSDEDMTEESNEDMTDESDEVCTVRTSFAKSSATPRSPPSSTKPRPFHTNPQIGSTSPRSPGQRRASANAPRPSTPAGRSRDVPMDDESSSSSRSSSAPPDLDSVYRAMKIAESKYIKTQVLYERLREAEQRKKEEERRKKEKEEQEEKQRRRQRRIDEYDDRLRREAAWREYNGRPGEFGRPFDERTRMFNEIYEELKGTRFYPPPPKYESKSTSPPRPSAGTQGGSRASGSTATGFGPGQTRPSLGLYCPNAQERTQRRPPLRTHFHPYGTGSKLNRSSSRSFSTASGSMSDFTHQHTKTPVPPIDPIATQFERYERLWKSLVLPSTDAVLTFSTVPWPVIIIPRTPMDITAQAVIEFMTHAKRGGIRLGSIAARKRAAKDELLRWHPDKFESRVLMRVVNEEERGAIRKAADVVQKALIELLKS